MSKTDRELAMVALGAFALVALTSRKASGQPPAEPTGPLKATGGIKGLQVSARMGQIGKTFGSRIDVAVNYSLRLATAGGAAVVRPWPVKIDVRLGHSTTFGWKTASELGFNVVGMRLWEGLPTADNQLKGHGFLFTTPPDHNQTWDIHVKMFTRPSDDLGEPDLTRWEQLGSAVKKDGAIKSFDQSVSATGGISGVTVAQIGTGTEDILRHIVSSVPRGSNIRTDFRHSAGFNQSREFIPAFRTGFNPGFGQELGHGRGLHGRPFLQDFERSDLLRIL